MADNREERRRHGAEGQGGEGSVLCGAGVLQFLHHVSFGFFLLGLAVVGMEWEERGRMAHVMKRLLICSCNRLLFMTYNGWVMLAVAVGAFVGYLVFGNSTATKSVACH